MNQKGFSSLIIVLGIILIIGIASGAYYLRIITKISKPTSVISIQTEISNWKLYKNNQYAFQMKYPMNWQTYEQPFIRGDTITLTVYFAPSLDKIMIDSGGYPAKALSITISSNKHTDSELNKSGADNENRWPVGTKDEQITFAGEPALKAYTISTDLVGSNGETYIFFNKDSNGWSIRYPNEDLNGNHNQIFDQMLSSFQFTQ